MNDKKLTIKNNLNDYCQNLGGGIYFQYIYDHRQTHAIYGLTPDDIDGTKESLTDKFGAAKFRVVKNGNSPILCFKLKEFSTYS